MNIEEILEHLSATQKINNGWTSFSVEECKGLYDYITNLQRENKQLKEDKKKVIEYIKEKQKLNYMFETITLSKDSQNELLAILGDKENDNNRNNNNKIKNSNIGSDNKYKKILTELEEWIKAIMENASLKWGDNCAREFDLGCLDIEMVMKNYGEVLNKIQELKEKYK